MKKLTVSMAAALTLGVLVAPAAQAGTDPVYDPGSTVPSRFGFSLTKDGGGQALASGSFVEYTVSLGGRSFVKDLADDGMDTNLWVRYGKHSATGTTTYKELVATASGLDVSTPVQWSSPVGMSVDYFQARVCLGPGEDNCSSWVG